MDRGRPRDVRRASRARARGPDPGARTSGSGCCGACPRASTASGGRGLDEAKQLGRDLLGRSGVLFPRRRRDPRENRQPEVARRRAARHREGRRQRHGVLADRARLRGGRQGDGRAGAAELYEKMGRAPINVDMGDLWKKLGVSSAVAGSSTTTARRRPRSGRASRPEMVPSPRSQVPSPIGFGYEQLTRPRHREHRELRRRNAASLPRLDEVTISKRTDPDKWSVKEVLAHVARLQEVFEQRLDAILAKEGRRSLRTTRRGIPISSRSRSPPPSSSGSGSTMGGTLARAARKARPGRLASEGKPPRLSRLRHSFRMEYMAHHEAHHAFQMFTRRPAGKTPH